MMIWTARNANPPTPIPIAKLIFVIHLLF